MDFAKCVLWSMTIFDMLKMSKSPSEKEDVCSGSIELLEENALFLLVCFCSFRSLVMFGMTSVSNKCGAAYDSMIGMILTALLGKGTKCLMDSSNCQCCRAVISDFR